GRSLCSGVCAFGFPSVDTTQGGSPSAVPYLGHALAAFANGEVERVMFLSRASLFLGRCTNLMDGVSFVLERNPKISKIYR
ncbi:MAG: glycine reductase, partial [Deltaproteobacteria bacterium]|nr:glycine reductase [Candidatus Tharpella sp.]